jgi:hypothetical protein
MYYRRVISEPLKALIMPDGKLYWLFSLVKSRADLNFLLGKTDGRGWIGVYRGLSKLLEISLQRGEVQLSSHKKYCDLAQQNGLSVYGTRATSDLAFKADFLKLVECVHKEPEFAQHYDNKREGFFQNMFSRQFGILADGCEKFAIVDKEAVIGYRNGAKARIFEPRQSMFRCIHKHLSETNPTSYGATLDEKALGGKLDFLAVERDGTTLLVEMKHGPNTKGIYLSPIQIGLYYSIFGEYIRRYGDDYVRDVGDMIRQKVEIGLISGDWSRVKPNGEIVPVLVIADYKERGAGFKQLKEVRTICRERLGDESFLSNLIVYTYDKDKVLNRLPLE